MTAEIVTCPKNDMPRSSAAALRAWRRPCALAQKGWSVRLHERSPELRPTGAGIYIYENGLRVLEKLGAYDEAVKGAPFAHTREMRDEQNSVLSVHRWDPSKRVFSIVRQRVITALADAGAQERRRDRAELGRRVAQRRKAN